MALADYTFESWVEYNFTLAHDDNMRTYERDSDAEQRINRDDAMDPMQRVEYFTRLCRDPGFIAQRYSDAQIGDAVHHLFGRTGNCRVMFKPLVPLSAQRQVIRVLTPLYTELFDKVCGNRGTDPDADLLNATQVDGAVYMIWDMDQLQYLVLEASELMGETLEVFKNVLATCRCSSCLISVLHGIGHMMPSNNDEDHFGTGQRMRDLIAAFRSARQLPTWVDEYAGYASKGLVQ